MEMKSLHRILLVDDEEDIQVVAQMALEIGGDLTVTTCSSGQEAVSKALEIEPDLILLDVMMPRMDGPTTLKEIRKNEKTAKIPIIFMTAKVQAHEVEKYKQIGAIDVIAKPFDPFTLASTIKSKWSAFHA